MATTLGCHGGDSHLGGGGDPPECTRARQRKFISSVLYLLAMTALNKSLLSCSHDADGV